MIFQTKKEALAAAQEALVTIQKIGAKLPAQAQTLVDFFIKVMAANNKTTATTKKSAPDLGDKDPQGADINALINGSALPQSVKDTLLEKYKNLSDGETEIFTNFLARLEKFYSDHKDDKAYFEAQKTTIEGLMIALITLIKKDGVNLQLPTIPPTKDTKPNPAIDINPDLGVEYKKVHLQGRYQLTRAILCQFKKGRIEARAFTPEISFTFALDKNSLAQIKPESTFHGLFTADHMINGLKLSNSSTWGLNDGGKSIHQIANAISLGDYKFEIVFNKYFKGAFKVECPKISSFSEDNNNTNISLEHWRINPLSISILAEANGKEGMLAILSTLFPSVKDIENVFKVAKCTVVVEIKLETELFLNSFNIGQDLDKDDKPKVEEVKKKAKVGLEKQEQLAQQLESKRYHTKPEKKAMTQISKEIADNTKEMVKIAETITSKQQKEIAKKIIIDGGKQVLKRFATKAALKFIPVVNVISTIWDVVELTVSLYNHFFGIECEPSPKTERTLIDTVDDLTPPELR